MKSIITISREFGSGGRTIGKKVAEQLGIPCYDQDLLDRIAEESGLTKEYITDKTENTRRSWFANAFADRSLKSMSTQDYVWSVQKRIIEEVAEKGPCVIIGRCADDILKDHPGLVSVFVTAPLVDREARIARLYPNHPRENYETHLQFVQKMDKARANYYSFHTDRDWGDIGNYHLCVNSSKLGIDGTVELLADYVKYAAE